MIPIAGSGVSQVAGAFAERLFEEYPDAQQSVRGFRTDIQSMADALWESRAPLLWEHHQSVRGLNQAIVFSQESGRSNRVLLMVEDLYRIRSERSGSLGLKETVNRIELVSAGLLRDSP